MRTTLGEVKRLVRRALKEDSSRRVQVPYGAWMNYVATSIDRRVGSDRPVSLWRNRLPKEVTPGNASNPLDGVGVEPKQAVDVVKKDVQLPDGTVVTMPDRDKAWDDIARDLALNVAKRGDFRNRRGKAVIIDVPSSSPMSRSLAAGMSRYLHLPYLPNATRKLSHAAGDRVVLKDKKLEAWLDRSPLTDDEKLAFWDDLVKCEADLNRKLAAGKVLTYAKDIGKHGFREFFSIVKLAAPGDLADAQVVIVVDDNVDRGDTLRHLRDDLEALGKDVITVAGYDRQAS